MKRLFAIGAFMGALLSLPSWAGAQTTFIAQLTPAQETPPTNSTGSGLAVFTLQPDGVTLTYDIIVTGLQNITVSHIHRGPVGVAGPVIIPFSSTPFSQLTGSVTLTPDEYNSLFAGTLYYNVHTTQNPAGEIRGQILLPPAGTYVAEANGNEEVPPIPTSSGAGIGIFTLDSAQANLNYQLIVTNLANITASHIHTGPEGVNGPIIIPFASAPFTTLSGTAPITSAQVAELNASGLYWNVHTMANPGGEIRGQVIPLQSGAIPQDETDWTAPITFSTTVGNGVSIANTTTNPITIGTQTGASDGYNPSLDLSANNGISSNFISAGIFHSPTDPGWENNAGLYLTDIRGPITSGQSKTWDLRVFSDVNGPITINWNLANVSPALQFSVSYQLPGDKAPTTVNMDAMTGLTFTNTVGASSPYNQIDFTITVSNSRALPRPIITALTVTPTSSSATLTWTTDVPASTVVNFGTDPTMLTQKLDTGAAPATAHTATVANLLPNTLYYFQVTSAAMGYNPGMSEVVSATTANPLTPVGAITATNVTGTSATINFGTNVPATAVLKYGTDPTKLTGSVTLSTAQATQAANLTGLTPGSMYTVQITSSAAGFPDLVQMFTFSTLGTLSISFPQVSNINTTTAQVTVTTSKPTSVVLTYGTNLASNPTTVTDTTASTSHVFSLTGLLPDTTYSVQATASATGFVTATSKTVSFTTINPIAFTAAPQVTATTSNSATITFTTNVPTSASVFYGTGIGNLGSTQMDPNVSNTHTVTLTGLSPSTAYKYQVGVSATGFTVTNSAVLNFTTPAPPTFVLGDVDGSGKIDITDVQLLLQFVQGLKTPTAAQLSAGDVVTDGVLDLRDVTQLLRFVVGLATSP